MPRRESPDRTKLHRADVRRSYLKQRYGLTEEEYEALMEQPCRICGGESEVLDHCHSTGDVRGPLCDACNLGLSKFKDDPTLLRKAADYLCRD